MGSDSKIFDDVFRTLLEKLPHLAIPLINEVFHTTYDESMEITQLRNEHQGADGEKITDSCLVIQDKMYHMECQSNPDSTMIIRMVEYDFYIALEHVTQNNGQYQLEFPRSCVLYLRHTQNTEDELNIEILLPDGQRFIYRVPVIKVQNYTKDVIFQKNLLFLLPFYVMRYEKDAQKIEDDEEKLNALLEEYEDIRLKLNETLSYGDHDREYTKLVELITRISGYIFREEEKVKKGVDTQMRGEVLEFEIDKTVDKAVDKARVETLYTIIGLPPAEIAEKLNFPIEKVNNILTELKLISA